MTIIDLSLTIEQNDSEPVPVDIEYISHKDGADILGKPIGINHVDFPDKMGLSLEHVKLTTHTGTHIDAPSHYGSTCEDKKAKDICDIPLEWCFSNGVVIDCDNNIELGVVSKDEVQNALKEINYKLNSLDILLIRTGADSLWGSPEYFTDFRGISKEATEWIVNQGVKIIGVDFFGFDAPFHKMLEGYQETKNTNYLWPAHILGRKKEYCQIERLANLSAIKIPYGFKVACFPIKIKKCGAGWSRVVAIT